MTADMYFLHAMRDAMRAAPQPPQGGAWPSLRLGWRELAIGVGVATSAAVTGYAAYKAGQGCARAGRWVRGWWRGPLEVKPAPVAPRVGECVTPESAVAGSEERCMTFPKFQALVGYSEASVFNVVGNAVRLDDWLMVPDHVKSSVGSRKIEVRTQDGKRGITLTDAEVNDLEVVDTDMCALRLSVGRWAELGLRAPSVVSHMSEDSGAYVSIVGAFGRGTTGTLHHSKLFGKVNYASSTFRGYSGAAYCSGTQLAAIHLHGGTVNSGYSASYLLALLKHLNKIKDEDTADWMERCKRAGARVVVDDQWRDLDECRIRVNGRYHIVDRSNYERVYGTVAQEKRVAWRKPQYIDQESAGEANPRSSGATSLVGESSPLRDGNLSSLTETEVRKWLSLLNKELYVRRASPEQDIK